MLLIRISLFIVPFIPLLIFRDLFFPFITSKAFVFRIIVEIVFTAWLWLAIINKAYRPQKTALLWAVSIFVLMAALATVFGVNPLKSFWSNFERMEGLVTYLHLFAYFVVMAHVFQKKDWMIFFNLFIVAGLLEDFYAFMQRLGFIASPQGGFRTDGTIGNPTYLAAYLIFVLALCIFLILNSRNKLAKYFYGMVGFLTLLAILFTASRGPTLGILIGVVVAALMYFFLKRKTEDKKEKLYKKIILASLLFLVVAVSTIWLFKNTKFVQNSPVLSRLTSLSFSEKTTKSRLTIWRMSFEAFKEKPILGWGPENYGVVFAKYYRPELWPQEPWFDRSHNIIFDWLINAGILGLLSYLGIFAAVFYLIRKGYLNKNISSESTILFSVLLFVYFFQNLFVFDNLATYIGFFTVLAFIHNAIIKKRDLIPLGKPVVSEIKGGEMAIGGFLLIPLGLMLYFVNIKPIAVNYDLLSSLKNQKQYETLKYAYDDFGKALSYNIFLGHQEISEQLTRFALSINSMSQVDADLKSKSLESAFKETEKVVEQNPTDPRPYLFWGNLFIPQKRYGEALEIFNKALEFSPKKQQIYFEIGDVYIKNGEYKNAIVVLEKAFNLDQEFPQARMNLAGAYILDNQYDKADNLLIESYGTVEVADNLLVQTYSIRKDYVRLVGIWSAFVKSEPKNINYYRSLAGAYLLTGKSAEAIQVLEQGIKIDPSFKNEAEGYINQIKILPKQ